MAKKPEEISEAIKQVIQTLMDRVMNNVLIDDPFIADAHRAKKPLYAALVPDEIFKGSHFERRFVTPFGGVWEKLAQVAATKGLGKCELQKTITGNVSQERLRRITEILNKLEHAEKGKSKKDRVRPDWGTEIKYILEGDGELIPVQVICDVYAEDLENNKKYSFEIKAPLPNSDQTKVSKEKILKLLSMQPLQIDAAYFVLPYNPYGKKEDYKWSFPFRWFNMTQDKAVLIGEEFWDLIGGKGTYQLFISEINKLGKEYRERIYREYLGIEPPERDDEVKI
ncbi:MAG TPA: TdeIII family type II restriction endonuclease [Bacteroidia bacterium]|nr:TdeIII family type II restriction endonuclease [Bacteroidia bacterium]HNU34059.1 TdeIII family type II restriction endonuclease [Bacteroidia bacterium]